MRYKSAICLILVSLLLIAMQPWLAACGSPRVSTDEEPVTGSESIQSKERVKAGEGGIITSNDSKVSVEIPAGALLEDTEITIDQVNEADWPKAIHDLEPQGQVIRLEPDGLEFSEPVTVSIQLDSQEIADIGSEEGTTAYTLISVGEDGEPEYLEETETHVFSDGSIVVSGQLSHFSWLIRTKSALQAKLWEQEEPKQIDEEFETTYHLLNRSTGSRVIDLQWATFFTGNTLDIVEVGHNRPDGPDWFIPEFAPDLPNQWPVPYMDWWDDNEPLRLAPGETTQDRFFKLAGRVEPGVRVYTLEVWAIQRIETAASSKTQSIKLVMDSTVKIVKKSYHVTESGGNYIESFISGKDVAGFTWRFQDKASNPPTKRKYVCIVPTELPHEFREKYDSRIGIIELGEPGELVKAADNLYIPWDEAGDIGVALETQIPGRYAFEVCGILLEDFKDDESYEGDGDEIVVVVPEPPESTQAPTPEITVSDKGYVAVDSYFYEGKNITKYHCYWIVQTANGSDLGCGSTFNLPYTEMTGTDGSTRQALFEIVFQKGATRNHYYVGATGSDCPGTGSRVGQCGCWNNSELYINIGLSEGESAQVSIASVNEDYFTYTGNGDPIIVTHSE